MKSEDRLKSLESQVDDLWFWLFLSVILVGFLGFRFYPQQIHSGANENPQNPLPSTSSEIQSDFDGKFQNPLPAKIITSGFGFRIHPITGQRKMHWGIDWSASTGTPINAIGAGVVTFSGFNGGCGYEIKIKHSNQLESRYCHCSKLLVKVGESVQAGQPIALVGSTGMSTGPHLHLEIHENDKPVDPRRFLP